MKSGSGANTVLNDAMNVIGSVEDGVAIFRGIPYAEPPVGDLRFAPPVEKEMWSETRDCTQWGDACYQIESLFITLKSKMSDDSLNLTIFAPLDANSGDKLPVFVWFPGGGYAVESSAGFDCSSFARNGVIAVTVQSRLSASGYLALESFRTEEYGIGNWGMLDQICALKWIQKNIGKFGGDKNKVTIAGQSSGSYTVMNMMLCPMAKGLFHNGIMESMGLSYFFDATLSTEKALEVSRNIAKSLGADDSPEGVKKLRSVDSMALAAASQFNTNIIMGNSTSCWPVYDGVLLPEDPYEVLEKGKFNKDVNILSGFAMLEGYLLAIPQFATEENLNNSIRMTYTDPKVAEEVIGYYKKSELPILDKVAQYIGLGTTQIGMSKTHELLRGKVKSLYCYQFDFASREMPPTHSAEMRFALGYKDAWENYPEFTGIAHGYWVNFAKNGNPNGEGLAQWDQYGEDRKAMHLNLKCEMRGYDMQGLIDSFYPWYFRSV